MKVYLKLRWCVRGSVEDAEGEQMGWRSNMFGGEWCGGEESASCNEHVSRNRTLYT